MAYTFFENYHETIKEFSNGSLETYGRLMMIINSYAIEGVILDDMTPVEKLFFNIIKPNLDKSLQMRERGKKGGRPSLKPNSDMVKTKNDLGFNEVEVEVEKEIEEEKEVEVESNKDPAPTLLTTQKIIKKFATSHGFKFGAKTLNELADSLSKTADPSANLEEQLDYVQSKYPTKTGDELAKLFVASLHWNDKKRQEKLRKEQEPEKNPPPEKCPICNSKLVRNGMDSVICANCREAGRLVWWEKEHGKWKRQDTETA